MKMQKCVDSSLNRLIYLGPGSDSGYWDQLWEKHNNSRQFNKFVEKYTKQYLRNGGKVVDGGCGNGSIVHTLQELNYDSYGIDFAEKTVELLNNERPDLKITKGDVRKTEFSDEFFDGYWSLGVIEHFKDGYFEIIDDMYRVLKKDGILFLTVPCFSPLRRLKAKLSSYQTIEEIDETRFYQFAISKEEIISSFTSRGFELISTSGFDAVKELKDEISFLNPILTRVYNSNNFLMKVVRKSINVLFSSIFHHSRIYILKKSHK